MARLRSIVKHHDLAVGSQTVPNSVAEAAAAQGKSPQAGSPSPATLPAPERKKLPLKRAKSKTPTVVSDEEEDESTEDGLVCKRKRATTTEPPAVESTSPNYAENTPSASTPFESAGDALHQTPQLLRAFKSKLWTLNHPPNLEWSQPSHHHALMLPSPSKLMRVVVRTNPQHLL